ncbi:MAG: DUF520 family protein, partial [Verrucomicrobiota bacterium]
MPSFDIVSEVDKHELDNAINQARKELATRFDFKGSSATIELEAKENKIKLTAEDASRLKSLSEIVIGKIAKRNIDLRNIERKDPAISPLGHATQEFKIQQGLEGEKAKEIIKAIKAGEFKVQSALQAANAGDEIWVSTGVYYPDYDTTTGTHTGNRDLRFLLKAGVRV